MARPKKITSKEPKRASTKASGKELKLANQLPEAPVAPQPSALPPADARPAEPETKPVQTVWVSKAPLPIKPVGGSLRPPSPELARVPSGLLWDYPEELRLRTDVTIGKAIKTYPLRRQTFQLCKEVLSEVKLDFCALVQREKWQPKRITRSMDALLEYLLQSNNDPGQRFRIEDEVRKSDEWLELLANAALASARAEDLKLRMPIKENESQLTDVGRSVAPAPAQSERTPLAKVECVEDLAPASAEMLNGTMHKKVGRPPAPVAQYEGALELRKQGRKWPQIAKTLNTKFSCDRSPDAWRCFVGRRSKLSKKRSK